VVWYDVVIWKWVGGFGQFGHLGSFLVVVDGWEWFVGVRLVGTAIGIVVVVVIFLETIFVLYFTVFYCSIGCVVRVMGVMVGFPMLVKNCL